MELIERSQDVLQTQDGAENEQGVQCRSVKAREEHVHQVLFTALQPQGRVLVVVLEFVRAGVMGSAQPVVLVMNSVS